MADGTVHESSDTGSVLGNSAALGRPAEGPGIQTARIVAHVRYQGSLEPDASIDDPDRAWAELAAPLLDRASALGGRLIAWGHDFISVDFAWDALYDAVDFLVDAPLAPELASGLSHGALRTLFDAGRVTLAVGEPLRRSAELAELARPGEVLVSPDLVNATWGRLATRGEPGKRKGRPEIPALFLDLERPLCEPSQPVSGVPLEFEDEPMSLRGPHLARLVDASHALSTSSLFPVAMGQALERRDGASLRELAAGLREQHSYVLAERLDAMAALANGQNGDAIRRLRDAKAATPLDDSSSRCRATLALGVALSTAGRPYEAILETLEALVQARRVGDQRGEQACARFMAQIADVAGDAESQQAWLGKSSGA